jgi:hypothetical protein
VTNIFLRIIFLVSAPENESGCSCFGEFFDYVMKIQLQKGVNQKFRFNILDMVK